MSIFLIKSLHRLLLAQAFVAKLPQKYILQYSNRQYLKPTRPIAARGLGLEKPPTRYRHILSRPLRVIINASTYFILSGSGLYRRPTGRGISDLTLGKFLYPSWLYLTRKQGFIYTKHFTILCLHVALITTDARGDGTGSYL